MLFKRFGTVDIFIKKSNYRRDLQDRNDCMETDLKFIHRLNNILLSATYLTFYTFKHFEVRQCTFLVFKISIKGADFFL